MRKSVYDCPYDPKDRRTERVNSRLMYCADCDLYYCTNEEDENTPFAELLAEGDERQ